MAYTILPANPPLPSLDSDWQFVTPESNDDDTYPKTTIRPLHGDFFPTLNPQYTQPRNSHVFSSRKEMVDNELEKEMESAAQRGLKLKGEKGNCRKGIENSTQYRPNLKYSVELQGQKFSCAYLMPKNSSLNGQRYLDKDENEQPIVRVVKGAVSSSLNRAAPGMTLTRHMVMKNKKNGQIETVCYAGRPDTQDKFKELATKIFLRQKKEQESRNRHTDDPFALLQEPNGLTYDPYHDTYELNFALNSFISTFSLIGPEADLVEKEYEELQKFNGSTITIKDKDGFDCQVKVNICFFSRQFNFMNSLEKELPKGISGERRAKEMSHTTRDLAMMIPKSKRNNPEIIKLLRLLIRNEQRSFMTAEEEIFTRIYLCQLAGIPLAMHCRSCVDRTSIGVAIAYALKQWRAMEKPIPNPPYKILDDEHFKELWFANIPPGLLMTMYSRSASGFKWQPGPLPYITQHPAVLRLMPQRNLTTFYLGNPDLNIFSKENFGVFSKEDNTVKMKIKAIWSWFKKKLLPALFVWLPICIMRSPIKTLEWIFCPKQSNIVKSLFVGLFRLISAVVLVGLGITTLSLAFIFGTVFGFFFMIFGIWREIGIIKKDSTLGKIGDVDGILLGFKLVWSLLVDLPPPQILKDGIQLNGGHNLLFNGKGQD